MLTTQKGEVAREGKIDRRPLQQVGQQALVSENSHQLFTEGIEVSPAKENMPHQVFFYLHP